MSEHIRCGGYLRPYTPTKEVLRAINQQRQRDRMKPVYTDFYLCDKCNRIIRIITCPSYNEYVEAGRIARRV